MTLQVCVSVGSRIRLTVCVHLTLSFFGLLGPRMSDFSGLFRVRRWVIVRLTAGFRGLVQLTGICMSAYLNLLLYSSYLIRREQNLDRLGLGVVAMDDGAGAGDWAVDGGRSSRSYESIIMVLMTTMIVVVRSVGRA